MEWNGKPPLQWEWEENLIIFGGTPSENPKKLRETDLEIMGDKGNYSGSLNSSANGRGNSYGGGSGSDFDLACLSKCSQSASISSSSIGEAKASKPASKASVIAENFEDKQETVKTKMISTSPTLEASVQSAEPLLSLKLGKHTYIGDNCTGSNDKTSSFSFTPVPTVTVAKRSKISHKSTQAPRCQVEGCDLDLSSAKDYHRKHRVCESHSRCAQVIVAGIVRRFCQQCSRFHGLSEFDEKKRSCRRRLSDHNARRRKPQSESVHLNPGNLSRSLCDGRQQMNIVWNGAPHIRGRCNGDLVLESSSSSKFPILRGYTQKPENGADIDGHLQFGGNNTTSSMPFGHHDTNSLSPYKVKSPTSAILNQGLAKPPVISSTADTTPFLHRALSLLSTNSWSSCEPKSDSLEQSVHTNHANMPQSVPHLMSEGLSVSSPGFWRTGQESTISQAQTLASHSNSSSYSQEIQLLRSSYDDDLFSNQLN